MNLTISIACLNKVELTLQCLNCLRSNSSNLDSIQFIITDNGSTDTTFNKISSFPLPNKIIIHNKYNVGFGEAHNTALKQAVGTYFLVLNNDLFINERGWDNKLVSLLERSGNAIVGIRGVHCTIRPDGTGYIGNRVDYIEGSFLAGNTYNFKTYGLFSPEMKMFLAEDSDLSFRYKQMGFKLYQIGMNYKHVEHATLDSLEGSYRSKMFEANRKIFHSRWSKCFGVDRLTNRVLISLSSVGIGDILCSTPTLKALRKDHPTAKFDVETRFPDVFRNHPEINEIIKFEKADHSQYDRVIKLNPDYSCHNPMYTEFERIASVTLDNRFPEIYLTKKEIETGRKILDPIRHKYKKFIVCSLLMSRVEWEGRNWTLENKKKFILLLRKSIPIDYGIVEIGRDIPSTKISDLDLVDKTSIRELFSIIDQSDIFVGIDSLPFHVAQAFRKKSVILFGATKPETRIIDHSFISAMRNERLECLGCYHNKREKGFNFCDRRDQACMIGIEPRDVVTKVLELI